VIRQYPGNKHNTSVFVNRETLFYLLLILKIIIMGMEVKSGEGTVVVADRNRYSDECCNNRGWGSGWGAVGGALVGGGFGAAAVSVWDKINDTKADIQKVESTVQEAKAGIYKDISDAARGVTSEVAGVSRQVEGVGNKTA
jgi:hypothetical protein